MEPKWRPGERWLRWRKDDLSGETRIASRIVLQRNALIVLVLLLLVALAVNQSPE